MELISSKELARRLYAEELDKTGTVNLEQANAVFAGKIVAGIKCTYCELYTLDGQKVYNFNKADKANSGGTSNRGGYLMVVTGLSRKPIKAYGRREQIMVEVMLTKNGFNYLCDKIERAKFPEGYTKLISLLYKRTNSGWVRNPRDVRFYVIYPAVVFHSEELAVKKFAYNAPVVNIYKK